MLPKYILELNNNQQKVATTIDGNIVVLAGAGSGKTKTIVSRVAYMIQNNINPKNILIITFTNKAAKEMKERGLKLLKDENININEAPLFSTFHAFGMRFIKTYIDLRGGYEKLSLNFTISNGSEKRNILKNIIKKYMPLKWADATSKDVKKFETIFTFLSNELVSYKSSEKCLRDIEELIQKYYNKFKTIPTWLSNADIENEEDIIGLANTYFEYKNELRSNNSVDFDDLISLPVFMMQEDKEIANIVPKKYKYVMVDEFQDTNKAQFEMLKYINGNNNNLCVVGDDSQSIYGWRGAEIEFILNFDKTRDNVKFFNLNTNYRSHKLILSLANKVIKDSSIKHPLKEELCAFSQKQGSVTFNRYDNEYHEAMFVANTIKDLIKKGVEEDEIAVLYRTNRQVHPLEREFIKIGINYDITKGVSILEKKIVQDYILYMIVATNNLNSAAVEELAIVGKFISDKKLQEVKILLNKKGINFIEFLQNINEYQDINLNKTQANKLSKLIELITKIQKIKNTDEFVEFMKFESGFYQILQKQLESKSENTKNLASKNLDTLEMFTKIVLRYDTIKKALDSFSLMEDNVNRNNKVQFMTIHSSKGLEYKHVFIIGLNDTIIPNIRSLQNNLLFEEDRRVLYVGITRAKEKLYLSCTKYRDNKPIEVSCLMQPYINPIDINGYPRKTFKNKIF